MEDFNAELKSRLQKAVRSVEVPPFLETRIRATLRTEPKRSRKWKPLAVLGSLLTIFIFAFIGYKHGYLRLTIGSQDTYISSLFQDVGSVTRIGLGDHVHCAVFRRYPNTPNTLQQMLTSLGPSFNPLLPVVRKYVPEQYPLVMAHRCSYKDRRFVHFTFRNAQVLLSVVIARKQDGEALNAAELGRALNKSGIPIYRSHVQRFQIAVFDADHYLVYVVSNLSGEENSRIAVALSPRVKSVLIHQLG